MRIRKYGFVLNKRGFNEVVVRHLSGGRGKLEVCGHRLRWYSLMSGCYTLEPNPTLNTRPQLKCVDIMRDQRSKK